MNNRIKEVGRIGDEIDFDSDSDDNSIRIEEINIEETKKDESRFEKINNTDRMIKEILEEVEEDSKNLSAEYGLLENEPTGENREERKKSSKDIKKRINEKLMLVKNEVGGLEKCINEVKNEIVEKRTEEDDDTAVSTQFRLMRNIYTNLLQRTQEAIKKFHMIETDHKERTKDAIRRKLRVATEKEDMEESDIQEFLSNPEVIYQKYISQHEDEVKETVRKNIDEAIETRKDLLELETDANGLVEMFSDMHELLKLQGENIDNIQDNIIVSIDNVEGGTRKIHKGRKFQSKTKCLCMTAFVLGICLALIIIIIAVALIVGGISLLGVAGGVASAIVSS